MNHAVQNTYKTNKLLCILILLLTFFAYYPFLKNKWTRWDDIQYTLENPYTQNLSFENIKYVFTTSYQGNYIPLTYLSFTIDRTLLGDNPKGFIAINILLHLINTLLVYLLIDRLVNNKLAGLIGSLLFGIHPVHVESVAWIAERKDVLYTCFFLLSIHLYVNYVETKKLKWLLISISGMILSVLSKNVAIVLPCVLLILDYFLKRDFKNKKIIFEKIPFLLIAILFAYIGTQSVQSNGKDLSSYHLTFLEHIAVASYAYIHYLVKIILPVNLSAYYPYPFLSDEDMPIYIWNYLAASILITGCIFWIGRKSPLIIFSLLFFIINIAPVLQFFPVGDAVYADRFVYVASFGVFLPFAFITASVLENRSNTLLKCIGTFSIFVCLFVLCSQRTVVWKNTKTLWIDVLKKNNNVSLAHTNLGNVFVEESKPDSALLHYEKALEINPANKTALTNRASVYFQQGRYTAAIHNYKKIISIYSKEPDAYAGIGLCYYSQDKYDSALLYYNKYQALDSSNADMYVNIGLAKHRLGKYNDALKDYNKAIVISPSLADAFTKRGVLKFEMHDTTGACMDWHEASKLGVSDVSSIIQTYCK
ncbi:MAG TPA: tetratricopeptide repeat protein, partial [Bacteroidia bacterium]|nr:tetratricopeptide repeat protein [Bacteroidia bacterium]